MSIIDVPEFKNQNSALQSEVNFSELQQKLFIDVNAKLEIPPVALSIGDYSYNGKEYPIAVGSYGDFSCIVGASKSKKTFLSSLFIASYIGGNANLYSHIKSHSNKGKIVLDFDTEQSFFHAQLKAKRVCGLVGAISENYKPYGLRGLTEIERYNFINYMILESEFKDNIGLIIIDGIADLITDINSIEQSTKITTTLLQWTAQSKAHLITILHLNYGTNKPTGHIGSFILKKAESVFVVEKHENASLVTQTHSRNRSVEPFAFSINDDGLPVTEETNNWQN